MTAWYNEIDPYAAQWLRNLIDAGEIAPGVVDERDIRDVKPDDLRGFTQCHFFAGIGVWSHALRQAEWSDDRPVWTGSCPCQPFSAAGKGGGFADERHLWPAWFHLIEQCQPSIIFGEQVASKDGLGWLDLVQADLEGTGYASGAVDLCAAGVGAPHIRQRLWFVGERVAYADSGELKGVSNGEGCQPNWEKTGREQSHCQPSTGSKFRGMANTNCQDQSGRGIQRPGESPSKGVGASLKRSEGLCEDSGGHKTNGHWREADWLFGRDGKWRPVGPGTFPLAHGVTNRVGKLRAYGNAIVAPVATEVITSYMEIGEKQWNTKKAK